MSDTVSKSRWSPEALKRRKCLESRKGCEDSDLERKSAKSWLLPSRAIDRILRVTGLYKWGRKKLLEIVVRENTMWVSSLPESFDGLRVLHLSDTHFDLEPLLLDIAKELAGKLVFDLCLFTGDMRDHLSSSGEAGTKMTVALLRSLGKPVYACLGNHDLSSDLERIENAGIRVLVNENVFIERGGKRIALCGVDDPGYYKTDDFVAAFGNVRADDCAIVLAHDPCAYGKACEAGAAMMLCGHTHGGQICLPGGIALTTHTDCPRKMIAGPWEYCGMKGYTNRGVGGSRVAARFFSNGEIVIHVLRKPAK